MAGIPLGLNPEEDRLYKLDRHENLFEVLITIMTQVRDNLQQRQTISEKTLTTLELLFDRTHSGEGYMFDQDVYMKAKSEKFYNSLFDIKTLQGADGWAIVTRSTDEISKLDYFDFKEMNPHHIAKSKKHQYDFDKLRTRKSLNETIS